MLPCKIPPAATHALAILLVLILSAPARAQEEQPKWWSLDAELHNGYVYEFGNLAKIYDGYELSGRLNPGPWTVLGRYRSDRYIMSYFGMTRQTFQQIMTPSAVVTDVLTQYDAKERKDEQELLVGRRFDRIPPLLLFGARVVSLINDFSSMRSAGPSMRIEENFKTPLGQVAAKVDGAWFLHGAFDNKKAGPNPDDFIVPDGERTISYYGEPRYEVGWGVSIAPFSGVLNHVSIGYDGTLLGLKYAYRYYQGLAVRAAF